MANTFSLTAFTSKTGSQKLKQECPFLALSYRGVTEMEDAKIHAPADTVNIKKLGYPATQTGMVTVSQDITDEVQPYTVSDQDIYTVNRKLDIREIKYHVVNGKIAILGNLNAKSADPAATWLIDNYVYPAVTSLKGKIEIVITEKCRKAAFMTPVDVPSKLKEINQFSDVSSVYALESKLGWVKQRYVGMNINDANEVANSLQNSFNERLNENISEYARVGGQSRTRLAGQDFFESNSIEITPEAPQFVVSPTFTVASVGAGGTTITFAGVDTVLTTIFNAGSLISIPSVNLINMANKVVLDTRLVICVAEDALGDGAGNVTVTLSEPLIAVGDQAIVDSLPAVAAPAELFPAHTNNYAFNPMGIIANPLRLGDIIGADNGFYNVGQANLSMNSYAQGVVDNGANSYLMRCLCPTLAYPRNLINLIGSLP